jgi:integrase
MAAVKLIKTKTPGVYRRGPSYVVRYRHHGQERRRYARTYDEARSIKQTIETDKRRGEHRETGRLTFKAYAREWADTYTGRTTTGVRQSTRDGCRWSIGKAVAFFDTRVPLLAEIEPRDVRAFVAWLFDVKAQKRELSSNTVRNHVATLHVMFATAVEDGVIRFNPAAGVRVARPSAPQKPNEKVRVMETEQLAAVLDSMDADWRLFFELLAATGLRIGEALELRWGDVDFGAKRLSVSRQVYHGRVGPPKSATGVRSVPLSTAMCRRLWPLQGASDGLLFTGPRGLHVDRRWLARQVLDPATETSGVPWVSFHTFRHTCASILFAAGKTPKQVRVWLGHADPAFTLRVYVHLLDDGLGDADFIDAAEWSTGDTHEPRQSEQTETPADGENRAISSEFAQRRQRHAGAAASL